MSEAARRTLAIHEAGHACAGIALGVDVRCAQLSFWTGEVRSSGPRREHRVLIAAGAVAEQRHAGLPAPATLDGCIEWAGDAESLRTQVAEVFEFADRQSAYRCAIKCAEIVVRETWPAIVRVADELLRCSYLAGAEVRSIAGIAPFDKARLPLDPHQLRDAAVDAVVVQQRERMLELQIEEQRRRMANTAEPWRPLLRAYNHRVSELHRGLHPRARHLHGDPSMSHGQFETSNLGSAGARDSMQSTVITRARQVQAAVQAGRVSGSSTAAEAARDALNLAKRGDLGAPLLAELERRMGVAA